MPIALEITSVFKSYGPLPVLKDVSLSVQQGEIFAIIGPNGAGKTTLFKVMTGEIPSDGGRISFLGEDVTRLPAHIRVRKGMGRTFQVARVFLDFTVWENVVVAIEARRRNAGERVSGIFSITPSEEISREAEALISSMGIAHIMHRQANYLSHGDKKRLEFLIALALKPQALMLDEPTAGMSPSDRMGVGTLIREISEKHEITVIMTEHDMDIVFDLADRIMVLNYGEIVTTGTVADIRSNPSVKEVYLGKEMYDA
jgi:branched-chain amino acid transport system ATP-binding protein